MNKNFQASSIIERARRGNFTTEAQRTGLSRNIDFAGLDQSLMDATTLEGCGPSQPLNPLWALFPADTFFEPTDLWHTTRLGRKVYPFRPKSMLGDRLRHEAERRQGNWASDVGNALDGRSCMPSVVKISFCPHLRSLNRRVCVSKKQSFNWAVHIYSGICRPGCSLWRVSGR